MECIQHNIIQDITDNEVLNPRLNLSYHNKTALFCNNQGIQSQTGPFMRGESNLDLKDMVRAYP